MLSLICVLLSFVVEGDEKAPQAAPPIDKLAFRIHVASAGRWECHGAIKYNVPIEARPKYNAGWEQRMQDVIEWGREEGCVFKHVNVSFPDDKTAMLAFSGTSDDPLLLIDFMRTILGLEKCQFLWDGATIRIAGTPRPKYSGLLAAVCELLGRPLLGEMKTELVVTSEGRINVTNAPNCKLQRDGHRLDIRASDRDSGLIEKQWSLSISELDKPETDQK